MSQAMSIEPHTSLPVLPAARSGRITLTLIAIGLIEFVLGASDFATLFGDMSKIPGPSLGGLLIKAHLATHAPLALLALATAAFRPRVAIVALAGVMVMTWLNYMPSVALHGLEMKNATTAFDTVTQIIAPPLLAACALAMAARNEKTGWATLLVAMLTLLKIGGVAAFAIGVSIYGF